MKTAKVSFLLLFFSLALTTPLEDVYTELKKNPRYRKMSFMEIAIDRGDFQAIRHFEFRTNNKEELKRTRVLLQSKIAGLDAAIEDQKREFLTQPEKGERLGELEKTRGLKADFEAILRETERKLQLDQKK